MPRSMTEFENPFPFDKGQHLPHPVIPAIERNCQGDNIVREGELVIQQSEE